MKGRGEIVDGRDAEQRRRDDMVENVTGWGVGVDTLYCIRNLINLV